MLDLSQLNPEQRRAATTTEGPLLVIAGPGSGKTAVIAARAAYLVHEGKVESRGILALTFTNHAGRELRRRIGAILGERAAGFWAGTFHAFALRLLRRWGGRVGLDPARLAVYADGPQKHCAVVQALRDLGRDPVGESSEVILAAISRAKGRLLSPDAVAAHDPALGAVYAAYQAVLGRCHALDFDDFLLLAVRLLVEQPDVRAELQATYRHVLVDEFQDVNHAQHRLLTLLVGGHRNVCSVGDPLQNLFAWRGSDPRYLLEFGRTYPEAAVLTLEQSYRGTGTLLAVANALGDRLPYGRRRLWTANPPGPAVVVAAVEDSGVEAASVVAEIYGLLARGLIRSAADCAVLYRTHAQARELEVACLAAGLPYRVCGDGIDRAAVDEEEVVAADPEPLAAGDGLTLSTIHAAKGLEWPVVFVVGLEEGLLPHARALDGPGAGPGALEEELRLCYVAITRAAERLYLSSVLRRATSAGILSSRPSRFLGVIPAHLCERRRW